MDRLVAARRLVAELVKAEQLEVRRAEIVGRDLAKYVETLGRPPTGTELEDWLGEHPQVTELYAAPSLLEELSFRHLAPPPEEQPEASDARHSELERQLRDAPDQPAPYLVYADWLQEQQDPYGELIALGVAAASGTDDDQQRFERYLKLHEARILGGLARSLAGRLELKWRNGFIESLDQIGESSPETWSELLALRACALLRSITLRRAITPRIDAAIAEHAPPSMRSLSLDWCIAHGALPPALMGRELRSLSIVSDTLKLAATSLPATLERLELRVSQVTLTGSPLRLRIRELVIRPTLPNVTFLANDARVPDVERLDLVLEQDNAARAVKLLEDVPLPALTQLAIRGGTLDERTAKRLAKLPVMAQLSSLSLVELELGDATMQALAKQRAAFPALQHLDVSGNELTREGLTAARELAADIVSKRQDRAGAGMEKRVRAFAGTRLTLAEEIADPKMFRPSGVDGDLRWARYRGTDEYELFVSADLRRYGCSCPSRFQPCKHVVALALIAERTGLEEAPSHGIEDRVQQPAHFENVWE